MENLSNKVAGNYSKNHLNCFKFSKTFSWMYKNEKSKLKNRSICFKHNIFYFQNFFKKLVNI